MNDAQADQADNGMNNQIFKPADHLTYILQDRGAIADSAMLQSKRNSPPITRLKALKAQTTPLVSPSKIIEWASKSDQGGRHFYGEREPAIISLAERLCAVAQLCYRASYYISSAISQSQLYESTSSCCASRLPVVGANTFHF